MRYLNWNDVSVSSVNSSREDWYFVLCQLYEKFEKHSKLRNTIIRLKNHFEIEIVVKWNIFGIFVQSNFVIMKIKNTHKFNVFWNILKLQIKNRILFEKNFIHSLDDFLIVNIKYFILFLSQRYQRMFKLCQQRRWI